MEIKGYHVLTGFVGAFGVIITMNVVMATQAVRTFPGLEVKNSYVASQNFNEDRTAQEALGWTVAARIEGSELVLSITDADGAPVQPAVLGGTFGRATSVRDDQTPAFVFDGAVHRAPIKGGAGNWNFRMVATAADGTAFNQRVIVETR